MAYLHINNLYKDQRILLFKEVYAMEKIHGTSAHVGLGKDGNLVIFSGGEKHERFAALFDQTKLKADLATIAPQITVYGEAYGGSQQGMRKTYGDALKFIAFDVMIGETWLDVPNAHDVCIKLGIDFVDYIRCSTDLEALNAQRDKDSVQAVRNGCGEGKMREGIVLRPPVECRLPNGERFIVKHKRAEFGETKTPREVAPGKLEVLAGAEKIAQEWVTEMRLTHVLDKIGNPKEMSDTGKVISAMLEDVRREGAGEWVQSKEAIQAINKRTAQMFKGRVTRILA